MTTSIFYSIYNRDNVKIFIDKNSLILSDKKTTQKISLNQIKKFKLVKVKKKSYGLIMGIFFVISLSYLLYEFSWVSFTIIASIHVISFLFSRQIDYYLIIQSTAFLKKIKINKKEKDEIKSLVYEFHEMSNLKK
jgi:hypothetical protein